MAGCCSSATASKSMAQLDGGKSPKAADRNDEDTARAALFLGFNFLSTVALININKYVFTKAHFGFPAALSNVHSFVPPACEREAALGFLGFGARLGSG